ncbi:MAG: sialate O-acetylesterase [Bacteroidota bacterium]
MPFKTVQKTNKGKFFGLFSFFIFACIVSSLAQIKVTMPVERSVFQRVNNVASIHIGGNVLYETDQIQAKITPIQGGQSKGWQSIDAKIGGGNFVGELSYVSAGWYKLEVRAMVSGVQVGEVSTVSKVGVGEVFIVAGQSNAQGGRPPLGGFYDNTYYGATDDRVNCIDYFDHDELSLLPFPKISQLKAETDISPHGHASWCWGLLGDKIAKELNVPVLFFNASEGGTRISQWAQAARGEPTYNYYLSIRAVEGWPYVILQKTLNYYASIYGARAILWHQGEDDGFINTNSEAYQSDLETVISKSREHIGKNISWMVAKVSRSRVGTKEAIREAQQRVADKSDFNVFPGPDTDVIQPSPDLRDDGVHFHGSGFIELADSWANQIINERFLLNSKPFLANPLVKMNVEKCNLSYQINASLPTNYSNPVWLWNNGNSKQESYSKTIIAYDENYGLVRDSNNNFLISPPFSYTPAGIEIKHEQQHKVCEGQSLKLIAESPNNNFQWNTGESTKSILVSKPGENIISVSSNDVYGCIAKAEARFNLKILPLPPSPKIEATSATSFCDGGKVEIKEISTNNYSKVWNTFETGNSINVSKSGNYFLQNQDENGCKSDSSNIIVVNVNSLPPKPEITTEGKYQFCSGDSLRLMTTNASEYLWKFGNNEVKTNSNTLYIKLGADYRVVTKNEFGCISSESDKVTITELQLPEAPIIEINGKNILCGDDSVEIFTKNNAKSYSWYSEGGNIEASTTATLRLAKINNQITLEKNYYLKTTDQNDCLSPKSNSIKIVIKPNPQKPIIEKVGPFTIRAEIENNNENALSFNWVFDDKTIDLVSQELKIKNSGRYKVKAEQTYIIDNNKLSCFSEFSDEVRFDIPNEELILYPNPVADGKIFVETLSDLQNISIRIFTVMGEEVFSADNIETKSRREISLGKMNGYFVVIIQSGKNIYRRNVWIKNN